MDLRGSAMLLILATSQACAQPTTTQVAQPPMPTAASVRPDGTELNLVKFIFAPPPLQWDAAMLMSRPALQQTATDFANLTGGLAFGMTPSQVRARLADPYPGLSVKALPMANEYPGEIWYFETPLDRGRSLRMDVTACAGGTSHLVFLFSRNGLFRLSYRLSADGNCADTNKAAQQIFSRYVRIDQTVAMSVRYKTGKTEVVDVTDSTAGYLIPVRWRQGMN